MPIQILLADLRGGISQYDSGYAEWFMGITAKESIRIGISYQLAAQVEHDLAQDNRELMVAWNSNISDQHSEVGGVGAIGWEIEDHSVLTIVYQDASTTSAQIDASSEWMLSQYGS